LAAVLNKTNMKKITCLQICLSGLLLFAVMQSCKKTKDEVAQVLPSPTQPIPTVAVKGDYQPTKTGSTWTYSGALNYTVTAKKDTVFNGKIWSIFRNSSASSNAFFRKENGDYYQYALTPSNEVLNLLYLKDTVSVGTSWINDVVLNGTKTRYQYTLIAVGLNKTVGASPFTNVLQVHLNVYVDVSNSGNYTLYSKAEYYYAKDVGFIYSDLYVQGITQLSTYFIK
jgi:hypothetical protein